MSKAITNKEFNETLRTVTNYLSWETDTFRLETAIRMWGHFQEECNKSALCSDWKEAKRLLLNVVERSAS